MKISQILGVAIGLLGITVLIGWWMQVELIVRVLPGLIAMTPNTALCFTLSGAVLAMPLGCKPLFQRLKFLFILIVVAVSGLTVIQHAFNLNLGIDTLLSPIWLADSNFYPGRMAPQTTAGFIVAMLVATLLNLRLTPFSDGLIHACLILLGAVGGIGVIGYVFNLSLLYSWYQQTAIAIHTAFGFLLLTIGLWYCWVAKRRPDANIIMASRQPLGLISSSVIIVAIMFSGLFGFVVLVSQTEKLQRVHLENILRMQVAGVKAELEAADEATSVVASLPFLIQQIKAVNTGKATEETFQNITDVTSILVTNNITALQVSGLDGNLIKEIGHFENKSEFDFRLDHTHQLLWNAVPILRRKINIMSNGQLIGKAVVEMRLPRINALLTASHTLGMSAETGLCVLYQETAMQCMPTRHRPQVFKTELVHAGKYLPMTYALDGGTGSITTRDYRNQDVLAAYSVVSPYLFGMVTKINTIDLFAAIRQQFQFALALLAGFIIAVALAHRSGAIHTKPTS